MLNARRMNSTTRQNMCLGFQNTKDHYLWGYTAPEKRPGTVMQTRRQRDHQSNKLIRRPRSTQHSKCTIFRVHSHTFQQERIKSAQDHGLAPTELASNRIRSASRSTLSQHTSDQRAEAAQWVRLWVAEPPPRANHVSSMPSPVPVERRASRLIQLEICVPLQPRTDKTFNPPMI
jgi:hypothetical protein